MIQTLVFLLLLLFQQTYAPPPQLQTQTSCAPDTEGDSIPKYDRPSCNCSISLVVNFLYQMLSDKFQLSDTDLWLVWRKSIKQPKSDFQNLIRLSQSSNSGVASVISVESSNFHSCKAHRLLNIQSAFILYLLIPSGCSFKNRLSSI